MRASDVIGRAVVDAEGVELGPVRDLRVAWDEDAPLPPGAVSSRFEIAGLVVGGGPFARIAHAWGFAEGRAAAPWLLRKLLGRAVRAARFVPAEHVHTWGPDAVELDCRGDQLRPLRRET